MVSDLLGLAINDYEILVLYFVVFCLEGAGESLLSGREMRSNLREERSMSKTGENPGAGSKEGRVR